jgi:FtsP/CotA-like multicopper oxidase with cupredoxin domain
MQRPRFSRRDLIKMGLMGTGYIVLGPEGRVARIEADGFDFQSPTITNPWIHDLPLPAAPIGGPRFADCPPEYARFIDDDTQFFEIEAVEREVSFHPDIGKTAIWGYRDMNADPATASVLGPTFKQRFGPYADPFTGQPKCAGGLVVRHHNNLPANHSGFGETRCTVHFHGGHVQAQADGFPEDLVNPPPGFPNKVVIERGTHYDYCYPMLDPGFDTDLASGADHVDLGETPSTLWYHDHLLDFTGPNAYRGLAGFFLAFDDPNANLILPHPKSALDVGNELDPRGLRLPSGRFDIPLVLQDKLFARDGSLVFNSFDHDGFIGDRICVNGAIQPRLRVQRRKYRFRFLNGSNARIYQIFLANGSGVKYPMTQIATEGGLLAAPIRNISNVLVYMAERVEVVIDFSAFPLGTELFFENRLQQDEGRKPDGLMSRGPQILKFIVDSDPPGGEDPSRVPDVLRPFEKICDADKQRAVRRTFEFERTHGAWAINDQFAGQLTRPMARVRLNQPEIWRLVNNSGGWWHPIHIHSEFHRVLSRNGRLPPLDERDGMAKKDTILLRDNESVEVYFNFRDHPGPWVFHCHNMEHEDMAMMARFDVVP